MSDSNRRDNDGVPWILIAGALTVIGVLAVMYTFYKGEDSPKPVKVDADDGCIRIRLDKIRNPDLSLLTEKERKKLKEEEEKKSKLAKEKKAKACELQKSMMQQATES